MEGWSEAVKQYAWVMVVGVVGVGLLGYGVWEEIKPREVKVEIVKSAKDLTSQQPNGQIVVDVAGAVEAPGVYKLPGGSRIGDALVAAGGLSAQADRAWVAATINLAETIKDGRKIYIPTMNGNEVTSQQSNESAKPQGKININTASAGELDSLPGIGSVRAEAIIANRPYAKVEELVSKAKIPQSVYEDIVNLVSVY